MKLTVVLIGLLSVSSSWGLMQKKMDDKGKREAEIGYPSSGHSSHTLQIQPSLGHEEGQAISISAGYSVGGAKPAYSFAAPAQTYQLAQPGPSAGHPGVQLSPIAIQGDHGLSSNELSQLMSQLSHGISSGAISLQPAAQSYQGEGQLYQSGGQLYQSAGQLYQGGAQEASGQQQYSYGAPKYQLELQSSQPSYAAASKGLGSYSSTGPVLFSPSSDSHGSQAASLSYSAPSSGHSFGDSSSLAGLSLGSSGGYSLGGSGGHSLGGSSGGHSLGGASSGHSLGGPSSAFSFGGSGGHSYGGLSLGGSGHSFGPIKSFGGSYAAAPSKTSFKPSAYLGSSAGDSAHSIAALGVSHTVPSFGHSYPGGHGGLTLNSLSSGSHGPSFGASFPGFSEGSSKLHGPSYLPPKSEGFGSSLESSALAFSSAGHGHSSSSPGASYSLPSGSYLSSGSSHGAPSSPQYYISSKHPSSGSFGEGSQAFRSHSSHGPVSSFSAGPKYSFGGQSRGGHSHGPRFAPSKDIQGSYSENSYNTIKYSEELKPRAR
ncbi:prisilkin-39 [Plutella xylostella]|uniref:prisilkin-39 n=1 Tax=Plutella xylostella TaxID=51655 RepID=UPI0020326E44|nr:prisilkin-39 [Plutella xylostella]